jgi:hypothetical protein
MWATLVTALAIVAGVSAFPLNGKRSLYPRSGIDYCAQAYNASLQTDYGYFPSSLALKCLQQLPYDQAVAEATIDSFIKMFAFYAPESYVIKSPNPDVGLSVDIASQLQSIKQSILAQKYSYFEYQYALANLVKSLNDGSLYVDLSNRRAYWVFRWLLPRVQNSCSSSGCIVIRRWPAEPRCLCILSAFCF